MNFAKLNKRATHSAAGSVRVLEPGASRAIYQGGRADHVGSDA